MRRSLSHKLLSGLWMLALAEFCKVVGGDHPGKAELPGHAALPFARDDAALRPIVLLLGGELLLVVALCLACGKWLRDGQHGSSLTSKIEAFFAVVVHSDSGLLLQSLRRCAWRFSVRRRGRFWLRLQFKWTLGISRSYVFGIVGEFVLGRVAQIKVSGDNRQIQVREREARHIVLVLHIGMEIRESGDFGLHYKRLNLPVQREVPPGAGAVEVSFAQSLDLDFPNELADPLASGRLLGLQPNAGCRLGQHDLSQVAVEVFQLGLTLETQNYWILALPIFCNGRMELR